MWRKGSSRMADFKKATQAIEDCRSIVQKRGSPPIASERDRRTKITADMPARFRSFSENLSLSLSSRSWFYPLAADPEILGATRRAGAPQATPLAPAFLHSDRSSTQRLRAVACIRCGLTAGFDGHLRSRPTVASQEAAVEAHFRSTRRRMAAVPCALPCGRLGWPIPVLDRQAQGLRACANDEFTFHPHLARWLAAVPAVHPAQKLERRQPSDLLRGAGAWSSAGGRR